MKIIGIKTSNGFYITDELTGNSYNNATIGNYIINGNPLEKTFNSKWFKTLNEPQKVQFYQRQPALNKRYELVDESLSDRFKKVWDYNEAHYWDEEEQKTIYAPGFLKDLYVYKEDQQPDKLIDVDFEYETITEIDEIKTPQSISYKRSGQYDNSHDYGSITDKDIKFDTISQIFVPNILLPTQPCRLGPKESYDIVRKFIKQNINYDVAEITSDYDFCFTVKKKIYLQKPYEFKVDVNNNIFSGRKRKPKYVTKVAKYNSVIIFEMTPANKRYENYPLLAPFIGDNQDDLKQNIDDYLNHLISVINEPLTYCECCDGTGVKNINQLS